MPFRPRKDTCGWGGKEGCDEPHLPDSYMCALHSDVLAPIREAFKETEDPYGTRKKERKGSVPRCTTPGCKNPRKPGEPMCADCQEERFWQTGEED